VVSYITDILAIIRSNLCILSSAFCINIRFAHLILKIQGCVKGGGTVHLVDRVLTLKLSVVKYILYSSFVYIGTAISWKEYIKVTYLLRVHVTELAYFCLTSSARLRIGGRTRTVNCARYPKLCLLYVH
jgi:hypothetical protein